MLNKFAALLLFLITTNLATIPPMTIPEELYNAFTLDGKIPVTYLYSDDSSSGVKSYQNGQIQSLIDKANRRETWYYGLTDTYLYNALSKYANHITNKNVAVMGSAEPWYESILLAHNAHPTTIEYNKIVSYDRRVEVLTVSEFDANPRLFDSIISISSYEHDGLGRYGDRINPNGDIEAMQKTKKMLKDGGLLFLAVPVGKEAIVWNLHRVYGPLRLKALLEGWEVVDSFGFYPENFETDMVVVYDQPVFVLKPIK